MGVFIGARVLNVSTLGRSCPQASGLSPEYSHKGGLQVVITEKLLQIGSVTRFSVQGLLQWAESQWAFRSGEDVGWEDFVVGLRRRPSPCGEEDEGWATPSTCFRWCGEVMKAWSEG
jgi:hypothetical protein